MGKTAPMGVLPHATGRFAPAMGQALIKSLNLFCLYLEKYSI